MSPIKGLSEVTRLPRLGKIRLGEKVEKPGKSPYPRATDYFVVPPEVARVHGEKPKELPVVFPTNDPDQFAQQWLRRYSLTQGLVCLGDGELCRRKVDSDTGAMASHETELWEWKDDIPCNAQECPEFGSKRCRRVMNLQILLPFVPGLGVWQIDTSSFYSIVNLNSMVRTLLGGLGRCQGIPLLLSLGPQEVTPPGIKKKTVHIMQFRLQEEITLIDLVKKISQLPSGRLLLPEPEAEEAPEDLFPAEVLADGEIEGPLSEPEEPRRNPDSIKNWGQLYEAAVEDFPALVTSRDDVWRLLGVTGQMQLTETPAACYRKLRELGRDAP